MCTSVERGKKERGLGEKKGAFFLLEATLFFAPLHLAACSQANRKIVLSIFSLDASKTNRQKQTNKTRTRRALLPSHPNSSLLMFEQYR